jgi:hypothetical protein
MAQAGLEFWAQAIFLPQSPEWLELQAHAISCGFLSSVILISISIMLFFPMPKFSDMADVQ